MREKRRGLPTENTDYTEEFGVEKRRQKSGGGAAAAVEAVGAGREEWGPRLGSLAISSQEGTPVLIGRGREMEARGVGDEWEKQQGEEREADARDGGVGEGISGKFDARGLQPPRQWRP